MPDGATYEPGSYRGLARPDVLARVRAEGWAPVVVADPPGAVYRRHRHPEAKLLAFLAGSMNVTIAGKTYGCGPGDKLAIPGNVEHAAIVGPTGCTYLWSEQIREAR